MARRLRVEPARLSAEPDWAEIEGRWGFEPKPFQAPHEALGPLWMAVEGSKVFTPTPSPQTFDGVALGSPDPFEGILDTTYTPRRTVAPTPSTQRLSGGQGGMGKGLRLASHSVSFLYYPGSSASTRRMGPTSIPLLALALYGPDPGFKGSGSAGAQWISAHRRL